MLPRVFDLFVQGNRSVDRAEGGLGLGLAIVKSLVELHGGTVAAQQRGPGPRQRVRDPPAAAQRAGAGADRCCRAAGALPRRRKRRVLVVDDNVDAAEMLASCCSASGHEVEVAHDRPTR